MFTKLPTFFPETGLCTGYAGLKPENEFEESQPSEWPERLITIDVKTPEPGENYTLVLNSLFRREFSLANVLLISDEDEHILELKRLGHANIKLYFHDINKMRDWIETFKVVIEAATKRDSEINAASEESSVSQAEPQESEEPSPERTTTVEDVAATLLADLVQLGSAATTATAQVLDSVMGHVVHDSQSDTNLLTNLAEVNNELLPFVDLTPQEPPPTPQRGAQRGEEQREQLEEGEEEGQEMPVFDLLPGQPASSFSLLFLSVYLLTAAVSVMESVFQFVIAWCLLFYLYIPVACARFGLGIMLILTGFAFTLMNLYIRVCGVIALHVWNAVNVVLKLVGAAVERRLLKARVDWVEAKGRWADFMFNRAFRGNE
jgi:hypothetical protein